MSAKQDEDMKDPRYPWTARQRRQKTSGRAQRKRDRPSRLKRTLRKAPRRK